MAGRWCFLSHAGYRLQHFRHIEKFGQSNYVFRCITSSVEKKEQKEKNTRAGKKSLSHGDVPLVPKRDNHAVLKALSSTVEKLEHPLIMGRSPADPLAPRSRQEQMEFVMALAAGEKAAKYFIHRWPKLFKGRKPEPDLRAKNRTQMKGCSEETLQSLIVRRKTQKALKMYKALQEKGEPVSIEVQNNLLRLLGHYGMGIPWKPASSRENTEIKEHLTENSEVEGESETAAEISEDSNTELPPMPGVMNLLEEEEKKSDDVGRTSHRKGPKVQPDMERVWNQDNMVEKFFSEMETKNGGTYDALIPSLVKFKDYARSFEMFDTLRSLGYQASRSTYNSLLKAILATGPNKPWKRAKDLLRNMEAKPVVLPNTSTFNLLLQIARKSGPAGKQLSLEVMEEMQFAGTKPNLTTFTLLLQCHIACSDASILYDVISHLENNRELLTIDDPQDVHFFPTAISVARYLRDFELGRRIKALAEQDHWYLTQNIGFFLNHYLVLLSYAPNLDYLMTEYRKLVPYMHVPREWVYSDLFEACEEKQLPDAAIELFDDMRRRKVNITDIKIFRKLFSALSVKLNLERLPEYAAAVERIRTALHQCGYRPTEFMITQMIRISALGDDVVKAMEYYSLFETYQMKPTFMGLLHLLEAHAVSKNVESFKKCVQDFVENGYHIEEPKLKKMMEKLLLSETERMEILNLVRQTGVGHSNEAI